MMINHKVKIDLVRQGIPPKIHVVQGDTYTRKLSIALFSDRRPWRIPENTVALIRYLKPDRTSGTYDTLADGTPAVSISGNTVTVLVAPEALTLAGDVSMVVTLILGEQRLSTFEIDIWVQQNCSSSLSADTDTAWVAGFLPTPENATVGQHLVVEKVDETGHVLALKSQDLPDIGKSVYAYATDNGYTGTEEEFAKQMAKGGADEIVVSVTEPAGENVKVWINPEEVNEEAGGADIDVTAEVGQTIIVKEVNENGKPAAWEAADYQEKICSHSITELLPETSFAMIEEDSTIIFYHEKGSELISYETYTVSWNGVSYACVAHPLGGLWILGNPIIIDGEDNGMPFTIGITRFETIAIPLESVESATVSIVGPVVQPVDSKFLPILVVKSNSESLPATANYTSINVHDAAACGKPVFLWMTNFPPYYCQTVENNADGLIAIFYPMGTNSGDAIHLDANGNLYQE